MPLDDEPAAAPAARPTRRTTTRLGRRLEPALPVVPLERHGVSLRGRWPASREPLAEQDKDLRDAPVLLWSDGQHLRLVDWILGHHDERGRAKPLDVELDASDVVDRNVEHQPGVRGHREAPVGDHDVRITHLGDRADGLTLGDRAEDRMGSTIRSGSPARPLVPRSTLLRRSAARPIFDPEVNARACTATGYVAAWSNFRSIDPRRSARCHPARVDLRIVVGIVVGILVLWAVLLALFWLLRPKGVSARELVGVVPDLVRMLRDIVRDPATPLDVRVVLVGLLVWIVSPIDLIPEFIPVLGPLDDVLVAVVALRYVRRRVGVEGMRARWRGTDDGLACSVVSSASGTPGPKAERRFRTPNARGPLCWATMEARQVRRDPWLWVGSAAPSRSSCWPRRQPAG